MGASIPYCVKIGEMTYRWVQVSGVTDDDARRAAREEYWPIEICGVMAGSLDYNRKQIETTGK
jgi:hypothetical protein